ncbi:nose resistant to fluoxetine protein 6-like [Chrysoperla carnea]|uniref:nose resistant to fluoxetine protein 6-like n=1 Tax=Chrysoperla carnea TaxID=189513 RepID=UPI001D065A8B|nr:nose resistant to fluoxetine protein 6-like [Chrysoperla carnea]
MSIVPIKLITISFFLLIYNVNKSIASLSDVNTVMKFYSLQSDTELSDVCRKQSDIYYRSLLSSALPKNAWAKDMIDASSKFQPGVLQGNLVDFGAFDECLGVNYEKKQIKGKYCLTKLKISSILSQNAYEQQQKFTKALNNFPVNFGRPPPDFSQRWAICVPHGCTAKDVETHLNSNGKGLNFTVKEEYCQSIESQPKLDGGDWTIIAFAIALACIVLLSTIYDVFLHHVKKDPRFPITVAFSCYTNFQKLIKINNHPDQLPCLNGIRVMSIIWIIHGHEIMRYSSSTLFNSKHLLEWTKSFNAMSTISASISVDSFFFLSGLLLMYGFLKSQVKKIPFNIPIFYIHRYLRLTPAYAAIVIVYLTLYNKIGTGPNWEEANHRLQTDCQAYWWSSLLYIQNYVNPDKNCVGQSWYLSVDMQLYILSPLILIPIGKWPKITSYLLGCLAILSIISPTVVAWHYEIPASGGQVDNWFRIYYAQLHTRAGPWIIGLAAGYVLFQTKHKKFRLNRVEVTIMWILTGAVMLFIVFGNWPIVNGDFVPSRLYNSLYIGFHRSVWALGLSWIVFACIHGYGGPVNWILSLSVFQFFAKLTYSLYLIHVPVQNYDRGTVRIPIIFNEFRILQSFFSTACLSTIIAIIWVLCFEYPFAVIDGVIIKAVSSLFKKNSAAKETKEIA